MYSLSQGNNLSLMLQLLLSLIKAYYLILNSISHKSMPTPHSVAVPLYQKKIYSRETLVYICLHKVEKYNYLK